GAPSVFGTLLSHEELMSLFNGGDDEVILGSEMTRNNITNTTASMIIGLKDHMGHFIMSHADYEKIADITTKAKMLYMSHAQGLAHAERLVKLSKGRDIHLAHLTAVGCGTHGDPVESMNTVLDLCKNSHVSTEFVTSQLRKSGGSREGLIMPDESKQLAFDALESGLVDILVSDGQHQATMKVFGDTRDNIPALIELSDMGVLSLRDAIATMTANPTKYISERTNNDWWLKKVGHLGVGALGNVTIIDNKDKKATYTI